MKPATRKRFYRLIAFVVSCIAAVALAEGLASAYVWSKFRTLDVARLNEMDAGNIYTGEFTGEWKSLAETIKPHPWLGLVPSDQLSDKKWKRDYRIEKFPTSRDPKKFTVLLTGGSVAQMMGISTDGPKTFLEQALAKYDFGGRELVVLNAGQGATCQPRQAIAALMYADVADAVINLDGFNEVTRVGKIEGVRYRMDAPSDWFWEFNALASNSYERIGASWQTTQLRRFSNAYNSRAVFLVTRLLRKQIENSTPESNQKTDRAQFLLPKGWTQKQNCDFNMEQYLKYIRTTKAIAEVNGCKCAFFVQPCPAIGKPLTDEERRLVGPIDYAPIYQQMTDKLLTLKGEGVPIASLLDIFSQVKESVYFDACHCRRNSIGYRIMADAIAARAAELWSLKPAS